MNCHRALHLLAQPFVHLGMEKSLVDRSIPSPDCRCCMALSACATGAANDNKLCTACAASAQVSAARRQSCLEVGLLTESMRHWQQCLQVPAHQHAGRHAAILQLSPATDTCRISKVAAVLSSNHCQYSVAAAEYLRLTQLPTQGWLLKAVSDYVCCTKAGGIRASA